MSVVLSGADGGAQALVAWVRFAGLTTAHLRRDFGSRRGCGCIHATLDRLVDLAERLRSRLCCEPRPGFNHPAAGCRQIPAVRQRFISVAHRRFVGSGEQPVCARQPDAFFEDLLLPQAFWALESATLSS